MTVPGGDSVGVIDDYKIAVTGVGPRVNHKAIRGRLNRGAKIDCDIHSFMSLTTFSVKRVSSQTKAVGDVAFDRQRSRHRRKPQQVRAVLVIQLTYFAFEVVCGSV